jgi:hypothetical protein
MQAAGVVDFVVAVGLGLGVDEVAGHRGVGWFGQTKRASSCDCAQPLARRDRNSLADGKASADRAVARWFVAWAPIHASSQRTTESSFSLSLDWEGLFVCVLMVWPNSGRSRVLVDCG